MFRVGVTEMLPGQMPSASSILCSSGGFFDHHWHCRGLSFSVRGRSFKLPAASEKTRNRKNHVSSGFGEFRDMVCHFYVEMMKGGVVLGAIGSQQRVCWWEELGARASRLHGRDGGANGGGVCSHAPRQNERED